MKIKQRVTYQVKTTKNEIITLHKDFPDIVSACNYFNSIKSISFGKPLIEDIKDLQ